MKKFLLIFLFLVACFTEVNAQYRVSKGELYLSGEKLSLAEAKRVMSDISGADLSQAWEEYYSDYKTYRFTEILSLTLAAGGITGISVTKGGWSSLCHPENGIKKSVLGMEILTLCFLGLAGESHVGKKSALLGMNNLAKAANGQSATPFSLHVGPSENGVGLTVRF